MASSITSCQANQLLALQRDLMESGLMVTVGECTTSCTATPATTSRATRKTAAATKPRRGRPPKSETAITSNTKSRKMSRAGKQAIAGASSAYHAKIKELREEGDLTQKQARALYQEMKAQGTL